VLCFLSICTKKHIGHTINECICPRFVVQPLSSFFKATIRVDASFVPFNLPLGDDDHVVILEDLIGLRFNLRIGTLYVKQKMYGEDGGVSETIDAK
jgi:hypothetical protein